MAQKAKFTFGTEILAVARGALLKSDSISGGKLQMPVNKSLAPNLRKHNDFDLLARSEGVERSEAGFDFVVDCTGVYRWDLALWARSERHTGIREFGLRSAGRVFAPCQTFSARTRRASRGSAPCS